MPKRRENMLEAFKASADESRRVAAEKEAADARAASVQPPAAQAPLSKGQGVGGGAVGSSSTPPGGRPPGDPGPPGAPGAAPPGLLLPIGAAPFIVLLALLVGTAFLLGRLSVAEAVRAEGGSREEGSGANAPLSLDTPGSNPAEAGYEGPRATRRPAAPSGGASAEPTPERTAAESAFLASENRFTVLVCTYDDTEYGRDRAWESYEHLASLGYQAVKPRRRNGRLFLFVGASPSYQGLEALEKQLKSAAGPGGQRQPFRDAYRVNIEDYL